MIDKNVWNFSFFHQENPVTHCQVLPHGTSVAKNMADPKKFFGGIEYYKGEPFKAGSCRVEVLRL